MITVYLAFTALVPAIFWKVPVRPAGLVTLFGGWLLLPVTSYPPVDPEVVFPWWISGLALPGEMLVSKAWVAPTAALTGALLFDPGALRRLRPCWLDLALLAWCLWPLAGGILTATANPAPLAASLYLLGSWGALWALGRLWFSDPASQRLLLQGCAWAAVACLPFAIAEGVFGNSLYAAVYGPHPYAADGVERYLGFRPVGFFEHGTQYGIWVATGFLAALWLAFACDPSPGRRSAVLLTGLIAGMAQSVGGLLLAAGSMVLMLLWRLRIVWPLILLTLLCAVLAAALHLSGLVPLRWLAKETEIGQLVVATFKSLGRGSFTWRFAQDLKAMALIDQGWLFGTGIWDWWRQAQIRPWGLWLLLTGQYGLVGLALAYGTVLAAAVGALRRMRHISAWRPGAASLPLALIVLMMLADSMLNAFLHFPGLLAAGAVAARPALAIDRGRRDVTPTP